MARSAPYQANMFLPLQKDADGLPACAVDSVIELEVKVAGMQCEGCVDRVVEALQVRWFTWGLLVDVSGVAALRWIRVCVFAACAACPSTYVCLICAQLDMCSMMSRGHLVNSRAKAHVGDAGGCRRQGRPEHGRRDGRRVGYRPVRRSDAGAPCGGAGRPGPGLRRGTLF